MQPQAQQPFYRFQQGSTGLIASLCTQCRCYVGAANNPEMLREIESAHRCVPPLEAQAAA